MSLLSGALPALRLYCIGLAVALHQLLRRLRPGGPPAPVFPTQNGNVAIVTGGAKGIGYHTVKHLARLGMHVILETTEPKPPKKKINLLLMASDSDNENEHASVRTALDCY